MVEVVIIHSLLASVSVVCPPDTLVASSSMLLSQVLEFLFLESQLILELRNLVQGIVLLLTEGILILNGFGDHNRSLSPKI